MENASIRCDGVHLTVTPAAPGELAEHYDVAIFGGRWLALWTLLKLSVSGPLPRRILISREGG